MKLWMRYWVMVGIGLMGAMVWAEGGATTKPTTKPAGVAAVVAREGPGEVTKLPEAPALPANVGDLKLIQARVEAVAKVAVPATVAIIMEGAQGSGVIVSKDGYVLTAGHVSGKPGTDIRVVMSDGRRFKARSLGANNGIDSGMIKISDPFYKGDFPFVPVGSARKLAAGQWLVAIGHPGGYMQGRPPVVRLGRVLRANAWVITTDNPLISGDSGGPVFDLDGKLVGINSRIGASTSANLHVPIDTFVETWDRLAKGEEWGGASFLEGGPRPTAALGARIRQEDEGVVVRQVHPDTAADKSGLKVGDVIVRFNGRRVKDDNDLATSIGKKKPGDSITLEVQRESKLVEVIAKLEAVGR
ncbi:MAG: S1C family serine protease [Phycisphaerales bacterium]|nr:S1C family serine protease [Phycisphaerales bacterium]